MPPSRQPRLEPEITPDGLACRFEPHSPVEPSEFRRRWVGRSALWFTFFFLLYTWLDFVDVVLLDHHTSHLPSIVIPAVAGAVALGGTLSLLERLWVHNRRVLLEVDNENVRLTWRLGPLTTHRLEIPLPMLKPCVVQTKPAALQLDPRGQSAIRLVDHRARVAELKQLAGLIDDARRRSDDFWRHLASTKQAERAALQSLTRRS